MDTAPIHRLQCLEVWGGNAVADSAVAIAGLDAWVFSRPYGQADGGGDIHYVSSCSHGKVTRLLVADVAGHGRTVADAAVELRQLMREYADILDQTRFVAELNDRLGAWSHDGRFATALAMTYYGPTRVLTVCNAGHPAPLVYRAASGDWHYLDAPDTPADEVGPDSNLLDPRAVTNTPLGVLDGVAYEQFEVRLHPGDRVLAYTDSLPESRSPDGRLLGREGLLDAVRALDPTHEPPFIPRLNAHVAALHPRNLEEDDVTLLMVEATTADVAED